MKAGEWRFMMKVLYTSVTSCGGRSDNEDAIRIEEKNGRYLFALADGLGSYGNGRIAADLAVEASAGCLEKEDGRNVPENALRAAQERVQEKQGQDRSLLSMSTTLAVLYLSEDHAQWAHIGDSRVYRFRNNELKDQTKDHSVPQLLVSLGEISQDKVRGHPDQNRLLKVIGREWTGSPFTVSPPLTLQGSECFLICSDGFWEYIDEKQMEKCLRKSATPEEWLSRMEKITARQSDADRRDNYSAICVFVSA